MEDDNIATEAFVREVALRRAAWGLYSDGWALIGCEGDDAAIAVFSSSQLAAACAVDEWAEYEPRAIPISGLLDLVLPQARERNLAIAIDIVPGQDARVVTADDLAAALEPSRNV